jgi:hypothetical protein
MLNEIDDFIKEKCSLKKIVIEFNEDGSIDLFKMYEVIE